MRYVRKASYRPSLFRRGELVGDVRAVNLSTTRCDHCLVRVLCFGEGLKSQLRCTQPGRQAAELARIPNGTGMSWLPVVPLLGISP